MFFRSARYLIPAPALLLTLCMYAGPAADSNDSLKSFSDTLLLRAQIRELYANNITLLKNENDLIPLKEKDNTRIAVVSVNNEGTTPLQIIAANYRPVDFYSFDHNSREVDISANLAGYDLVIAGMYLTGLNEKGGSVNADSLLGKIISGKKSIIVWFGTPGSLAGYKAIEKCNGLVLAYTDNRFTSGLSAQLIFGGIAASGKLPVRISEEWPSGFGLMTTGKERLQYGYPENAGLSSLILQQRVDSVVNAGLVAKAYPGCEVMIARKGIVVFHKCYGFHTYDSVSPVIQSDLFDLASVTKVSSTLAGLMILDSEGKFSTDRTLGSYLPFYRWSNKKNLRMDEILTHQAGLTSWIPFWKNTTNRKGDLRGRLYSDHPYKKITLKVADSLYIKDKYRNRIFREIRRSPVGEKKYLYSDLAFIMSTEIIEELTGEKWHDYVTDKLYHKLGAYDIVFNPWKKYPLERIIPTEYDSLFRRQLIHGYVHDEGAAMLNGISGHAGLFSTANDLMKLTELYRRMGNYGGEQLIDSSVLRRYSTIQFPENKNRRGLGFDKPLLNNAELPQKESYPARSASVSSFGHSGFTGTFIWVDPDSEISYVFLSNRVHPTRNNNLLSDLDIRTEILQAIYDSIIR